MQNKIPTAAKLNVSSKQPVDETECCAHSGSAEMKGTEGRKERERVTGGAAQHCDSPEEPLQLART